MVNLRQTLIVAGILLVGCTGNPVIERPNPVVRPIGAGWIRPSWRICDEEGTCPQPTRKTVALAPRSPIQVVPQPIPQPEPKLQVAAEIERPPLTIHFGLAKEKPDGHAELENILSQIRENDSIQIRGRTDDIGGAAFNSRLARQRALFVAAWLKRRGVANPMEIKSCGKCDYVAANDSDEGRAANRRVVVTLKARQNSEKSTHNPIHNRKKELDPK
jgi:outer membrane protein OmpA-like peptidoglycan-associated protein